jgi:acetyl-CoA carboxylase biotin carboxylase subunit
VNVHTLPRSILIANRGEIAVRIMRTCREMGIESVAVYSDADRNALHVRTADRAVWIGPAPARQSYLDGERIVAAARAAGADAIHPGYGFLSENAAFAGRVGDEGLLFIGPGPDAIASMGDKTAARALMMRAGVPVIPGTTGAVRSLEEAAQFCHDAGFPVLLKAAAGGGGKGMRVVRSSPELEGVLRSASSEAASAFGDGRVYLERYLDRPRHIEVQILADAHGHVVHLGERECSIPRRHQKVIEESPSVAVQEDLRTAMTTAAVAAAWACGYVNAGTIEFLLDADGRFYFLEMNTRLQVEHPVTELRTGCDLVALQIRIAAGEELPFTQESVGFRGHALECRICAEDPEADFAPASGTIHALAAPSGPNVRDDRGVDAGAEIPVHYDSMIAKLAVWAPTRDECIARAERALAEYTVLGLPTNIAFCRFVLAHPAFRCGDFDTHFVEREFQPSRLPHLTDAGRRAAAAVSAVLAGRASGAGNGPVAMPVDGKDARSGWARQRIDRMRG